MSPQKTIRNQAQKTLKRNYVCAVSAFVILIIPLFIVEGITLTVQTLVAEMVDDNMTFLYLSTSIATPLNLFTLIALSPLVAGFIRLFYQSAVCGQFRMSEMFHYFTAKRYSKTLLLNLSLILRLFIPFIIAFSPVYLYRGIVAANFSEFMRTFLYRDADFLLCVLSVMLLVLYSLKYFVVFSLYIENENAEIRDLFRCSKAVMSEHSRSATKLIFSFSPWLLLCLTVLPILYVAPYMTQSLCIGAKWMMRTTFERKPV